MTVTIGLLFAAVIAFFFVRRRKGGPQLNLRAIVPIQEFRSRAMSFADLLPYALRIADDIVLNQDGSMTKSYTYRGSDLESASQRTLNALSERVNQTFRRFSGGWMFQVDSHRHPAIGYPIDSLFPDRTSWIIDEERRAEFHRAKAHYVTDYVLHVTYFPPVDKASTAWNFFIDDKSGEEPTPASEALKSFEEGLAYLESMLVDDLSLHRLRVRIEPTSNGDIEVDEQLSSFIRSAVNREIEVQAPRDARTWLAPIVACDNLRNGFALRVGNQILSVIAMDDVPARTYPGILDVLDLMDATYRVHWRFIVRDKADADQDIAKRESRWFGARRSWRKAVADDESGLQNVDAINMAKDANLARADLSNDEVCFGYFSMSVVVWETVENGEEEAAARVRLRSTVERISAAINKLHFVTRVETENALEAFLGTLPGIAHAQVRAPMLSSRNLADFIPTTAVWTGIMHCPNPLYPPNSPPLSYVSTASTTPFALNIHVGDVGHTLIAGATGGGKSALIGALLAQHRRYPDARQIVLDIGYSHYTLCMAVEGKHYDLANDELRFCPLAHIDDPFERQWAETWIAGLIAAQGLNPNEYRREVYLALDGLAHSDAPRSLTSFTQQGLPTELVDALRSYTVAGAALSILDGEHDDIELSDFTCFEMQAIRDIGDQLLNPLLEYLFHYIERACKGQPTILAVEEVWKFLENPQVADAFNGWLRTMRKKNVAVVFASQSIADLTDSQISQALLGSCLTKIYVANPEAKSPSEEKKYVEAGLTPWQCTMLAQAQRKRDYYVVSPEGRRMIELELGPVSRCFVGVSSQTDVKRVRALIQEEHDFLDENPDAAPPVNWQLRWMWERLPHEIGAAAAERWIEQYLKGQQLTGRVVTLPLDEERNVA